MSPTKHGYCVCNKQHFAGHPKETSCATVPKRLPIIERSTGQENALIEVEIFWLYDLEMKRKGKEERSEIAGGQERRQIQKTIAKI